MATTTRKPRRIRVNDQATCRCPLFPLAGEAQVGRHIASCPNLAMHLAAQAMRARRLRAG